MNIPSSGVSLVAGFQFGQRPLRCGRGNRTFICCCRGRSHRSKKKARPSQPQAIFNEPSSGRALHALSSAKPMASGQSKSIAVSQIDQDGAAFRDCYGLDSCLKAGSRESSFIHGKRSSIQTTVSGAKGLGSSSVAIVISIDGEESSFRNAIGVPQQAANHRTRSAKATLRIEPETNCKALRGIVPQVTTGAPAARRQSTQWQSLIPFGASLRKYRSPPQRQPPSNFCFGIGKFNNFRRLVRVFCFGKLLTNNFSLLSPIILGRHSRIAFEISAEEERVVVSDLLSNLLDWISAFQKPPARVIDPAPGAASQLELSRWPA